MTAQEAYHAIRRAGYRHGVTVKTLDQFEPDRSCAHNATIITADGIFEGVDIADACTKVIAGLPKRKPLASSTEWDYAEAEGRAQREREWRDSQFVVNDFQSL
jgi:hypothetical protein